MRTISHNLQAPDELEDEFPVNPAANAANFIQTRTAAESIAHDLNNVLSLITMAAELLGAQQIGKDEQRFLQIIEDGTARGQGISRRLFDLVKGMGAQ
jgi:signal transduction histidine kinase